MNSTDKSFSFTKKEIDNLPIKPKRYRCNDPKTRGLFVEVMPSGEKYFRVRGKIKGKDISSTLGRFPDITREQARAKAAENRNLMATGVNPSQLKKIDANEKITLEQAYDDYIKNRNLRPRSIKNYRQNLDCYFKDWKNRPLKHIGEETVKKLHQTISKNSEAQANQAMRFLRAIFNYAKYEYRGHDGAFIFAENPVSILNHQRMWHAAKRKRTRLHQDEFKCWFTEIALTKANAEKVFDVFTSSVCDALTMAILTGLRKSEILELTWDRVSLERQMFFIDITKNGDPLELPTTDHIHSMLAARNVSRSESPYVFHTQSSHGRIMEPKKTISKIKERSGIDFSWHDLRRTFASVAEGINVGTYTLKRLMNHRAQINDVTEGYVIQTADELRKPAQAITDKILEQGGIKKQYLHSE